MRIRPLSSTVAVCTLKTKRNPLGSARGGSGWESWGRYGDRRARIGIAARAPGVLAQPAGALVPVEVCMVIARIEVLALGLVVERGNQV